MAEDIGAPGNAFVRFGDNVRAAVRAYFAERARTNWKDIGEQIGDLYDLVDRAYRSVVAPIPRRFIMGEEINPAEGDVRGGEADNPAQGDVRGDEAVIGRVAVRIGLVDQATRNWLERCARQQLSFPSAEEILDRRTRKQAIKRLRSSLSYGQERVEGRKRPGGRRSRATFQPLLRVPESSRGRPRDLAARELVQQLALAYLEATGRVPPRRVNLGIKGPFFRLVDQCFHLVGIRAGNIVDLINEREILRKKLERQHSWRSKRYGLKKK